MNAKQIEKWKCSCGFVSTSKIEADECCMIQCSTCLKWYITKKEADECCNGVK